MKLTVINSPSELEILQADLQFFFDAYTQLRPAYDEIGQQTWASISARQRFWSDYVHSRDKLEAKLGHKICGRKFK